MKLEGEQLVLDTNVLVHWLRGKDAGLKLRQDYELGARRPRPIIPLVVKGEIKSLALQFQWGDQRNEQLDALLRELPVADISSEAVIQAYARIDHESGRIGRRMGKNDLWIAAVAAVQSAVVLTTDRDFDHLPTSVVRVELVDVAALLTPTS
ncbi:MAG TPA: PIN domain-containing protein [Polyangiaceae bacterium]|nr:PIN domain-containing protein [Polyangiaceae bacterium]